jgi:SAM-dependent methyltransferase
MYHPAKTCGMCHPVKTCGTFRTAKSAARFAQLAAVRQLHQGDRSGVRCYLDDEEAGARDMKWLYELMYRYSFVPIPYDIGPRAELVSLVESGRIKPCRAIDLGCGTASNVIYLAQHGFDVTGVDFSPAAIEMGRVRAREAGVEVTFIEDDLTNLQHINDTFDLLVDYGTLDDLNLPRRDLYVENVLPLAHQRSLFLLYCFEWETRWWERLLTFLGTMAIEPGEAEHRFGKFFTIERVAGGSTGSKFMPATATYLMARKSS